MGDGLPGASITRLSCCRNRSYVTRTPMRQLHEPSISSPRQQTIAERVRSWVVGSANVKIDPAAAVEFPGSAPCDYVRVVTVMDSGCGRPQSAWSNFHRRRTVRPGVRRRLASTLGSAAFVGCGGARLCRY